MTFPDPHHHAAPELTQEQYSNLMTYLISIPRSVNYTWRKYFQTHTNLHVDVFSIKVDIFKQKLISIIVVLCAETLTRYNILCILEECNGVLCSLVEVHCDMKRCDISEVHCGFTFQS